MPGDDAPTVRLDTPERRSAAAWSIVPVKRFGHSATTRELRLPAIGIGLPLLVDRALLLASGRLPEWRGGGWNYFDIDAERARQAVRILGATLERR